MTARTALTTESVRLSRYFNSVDDNGYSVHDATSGEYIGWVAKNPAGLNPGRWKWAPGIAPARSTVGNTRKSAVAALVDAHNRKASR